jgi:hypothetical protein
MVWATWDATNTDRAATDLDTLQDPEACQAQSSLWRSRTERAYFRSFRWCRDVAEHLHRRVFATAALGTHLLDLVLGLR